MQNLIIDGFNFSFIGAYSGFKNEEDTDEVKLNKTLYIIESMLRKLFRAYPYAKVYACWDSYGGTEFRKNLDSGYKANRSDRRPLDFHAFDLVKQLFEREGIFNFAIDRTEGDDAIYVLCQSLKELYPADENIIITRDRDMIQVVQAGYANAIYEPVKKSLLEIPGYPVTIYKALVGDRSDNIAGVKGVGDAKAKKIIAKYITTSKLELDDEQRLQYEKCLAMVDATKNPLYYENLQVARRFLKKLN